MGRLLPATLLGTTLLCSPALAAGDLRIYHWFEYMPQDLVDRFTTQTGIQVTIDTYDSNEAMLANLKAERLGQYDLAVPGDYMVEIMIDQDLVDGFEPDELSRFGNIEAEWIDVPFDPGRRYSIPYQWGSTAFSVNRDVYSGEIDTLAILFEPPPELRGRINVLDSQGEVLALASMYLGIPQCTQDRDQLRALMDMLNEAKTGWASFGSDIAKDVLVSGDAAAAMIYNGFSAKARQEGANVEYAYPAEGAVVWMDNVVLLKNAPNRDNALAFMDFLLEPENAAAVTNFAAYTAGVKGTEPFLREEIANSPENNPPADATFEFVQACDQETQRVYDTIWTNLKR